MITYNDVKNNEKARSYIMCSDNTLKAMKYTEHSFAHLEICARRASWILEELGYDERTIELAKIAAFLHDIGNMVNRENHAHHGAIIALHLLDSLEMSPDEISKIVTAIGHHDESTAIAVSPISAALIIADKSDVRASRVRHYEPESPDIHDRVNYAVKDAELSIQKEEKTITLSLKIDTEVSSVTDYFEIFLGRMLLCRKAADYFGLKFKLKMNGILL